MRHAAKPITQLTGDDLRGEHNACTRPGRRGRSPGDGRIIFDHITGANDELGTVAFINADGSGLEIAVGNEFVGGGIPHPRLRPVVR